MTITFQMIYILYRKSGPNVAQTFELIILFAFLITILAFDYGNKPKTG